MTFHDQKNLVFLASLSTYILTGVPAFGLVTWLIIAYDDYYSFVENKGHNHKILTILYFLSIWSSVLVGLDIVFSFDTWAFIILRLVLWLLVLFFNNSDDDWDDKLDKLKDSTKSVFWMGKWRESTVVSLA